MAWLQVNEKDFNMEVIEAYAQFTKSQKHPTGLTPLQRDMISVVVSSVNKCRY